MPETRPFMSVKTLMPMRLQVNGQPVKAARELRVGDEVMLRLDALGPRHVVVRGLAICFPELFRDTATPPETPRRSARGY